MMRIGCTIALVMAWDDYRLVSVQLHWHIARALLAIFQMIQGGHGLGTWEEALEGRPNPV